jgi:predicted RNA-binding protein with PUA-like domain
MWDGMLERPWMRQLHRITKRGSSSPRDRRIPHFNAWRKTANPLQGRVMAYWLMKSEPEVYSIDDFRRDQRTLWTGVRNYQARNFMMADHPTAMKLGDSFIFYHSNAEPSAAVGLGKIHRLSVPDPEQFQKKSEYFEPRATKAKPIWYCAEVEFELRFARPVTLEEMRGEKALAKLELLKRGTRLSIFPMSEAEFQHILRMGSGD